MVDTVLRPPPPATGELAFGHPCSPNALMLNASSVHPICGGAAVSCFRAYLSLSQLPTNRDKAKQSKPAERPQMLFHLVRF